MIIYMSKIGPQQPQETKKEWKIICKVHVDMILTVRLDNQSFQQQLFAHFPSFVHFITRFSR